MSTYMNRRMLMKISQNDLMGKRKKECMNGPPIDASNNEIIKASNMEIVAYR